MKKLTFSLLLIYSAFLYFNSRCQSFGYDGVVIGSDVFCVSTITTENYVIHKTDSLFELEGDAERYKVLPKPELEPFVVQSG